MFNQKVHPKKANSKIKAPPRVLTFREPVAYLKSQKGAETDPELGSCFLNTGTALDWRRGTLGERGVLTVELRTMSATARNVSALNPSRSLFPKTP